MAKMTESELATLKARMLGLVGNPSIEVAKDDEYAKALESELKGVELPESTGATYLLDLIKLIEAGPKKTEPKAALKKLEEPAPKEEVKVEEPVAPEAPKVEEVKVEEPKKADKPTKGKKADKDESDKS
jgi:outer membrane biosynthesis protein TonB